MPPKGKKKRASLHLDSTTGQIKEAESAEEVTVKQEPPEQSIPPAARQVVEVVDDEKVPEAIETIEEKIEEEQKSEVTDDTLVTPSQELNEEVAEDTKGSVESLFVKATSPVTPEITVVGKRNTPVGVWVGAMLGIVLAIGVSLIFLVRGPSRISFFAPKPTPTPTQTPAPTPVPVSAINRKDVNISILNGGGVAGAGTKMKTFLESKGYTVASVGNADAYTHDQTEILIKNGKDAIASLLKDDLKSDYTIASATGVVDASATFDAQVIVGK